MSIPNINFTIADGALGTVPANSSKVCVKMGICSGATASVAASLLVASTSGGGDGVLFTAKAAGAGGNAISVTYTTGASASPVVTTSGNAINVQIKAGTSTNTNVKTAVDAFPAAAALVSTSVVSGSDLAIAASQAYLSGGVTGNINTLISETDPTHAVSDLGYGPLTEAVCHSLNVAGGQVIAIPLNPSTTGTNTAVSHVGSAGAGTVAVSGTPNDSYSFVVSIVTGGALGVAQFKWSQDGGVTFGPTYLVPSGGTFAVPNTGLTLTFASTFGAGDSYTFSSVASSYTTTDVQNAFAALLASGQPFGFVHLVGTAANVTASATMASTLETLAVNAASTNFVFTHAIMECAADTDANILTAFASTVCTRVMVCAGFETVTSSIPGSGVLTRSVGFSASAREALVPEQNDLGRVADGPLPGVTSLSRNESITPGLDAANFTTARTFPGLKGFFITNGHMFENPGSDFGPSQNRRVMDLACATVYPATLRYLNDTLRVNSNGTITNAQATSIENQVNSALASAVIAPGAAVSSSVVIDRTNNVLSTKNMNETVRVLPFGYARTIAVNIGFQNPSVALQ